LLTAYVEAKPNGEPTEAGKIAAGKALVDTHCNRCHELDRVYKTTKSGEEWAATVTRMVAYSSGNDGIFRSGDDKAIIDFLAATQTPEAVRKRSEIIAAAATSGKSLVAPQSASLNPAKVAPASSYFSAIGILFLFGGFIGLLMLRRPVIAEQGIMAVAPINPSTNFNQDTTSVAPQPRAPRPAAPLSSAKDPVAKPLILQLVKIEENTPSAKTLRFNLPVGEHFWARPGQFITFHFLIDGKKAVRSYSICSSTARTGYIEITPKRVENGIVSTYLNDRAQVGLTVEAQGPFGQFYFDEMVDRKITLIAAGSGITPMISILRYISDRNLNTDVTLIYSARTGKDIIFEKELQRLKERLDNFRYAVTLTNPDADWRGPAGHINSSLLQANVTDLNTTFFICGPQSFMTSIRETLLSLGADESRIKQESFGGARANAGENAAAPSHSTGHVEFSRSHKVCQIPAGKSLLETAEINGVDIPFNCRQGQCGTCATRCIEGQVEMACDNGLDPDRKAAGYVLTCVGRAKGKVTLDA
jgi:ferredoxin-NADP reductase